MFKEQPFMYQTNKVSDKNKLNLLNCFVIIKGLEATLTYFRDQTLATRDETLPTRCQKLATRD